MMMPMCFLSPSYYVAVHSGRVNSIHVNEFRGYCVSSIHLDTGGVNLHHSRQPPIQLLLAQRNTTQHTHLTFLQLSLVKLPNFTSCTKGRSFEQSKSLLPPVQLRMKCSFFILCCIHFEWLQLYTLDTS